METVLISPRKRLQDLTGEWKGAGTMDVAGDSFPVTARWLCESSSAGFGLRGDMQLAGVPGMEYMTDIEQFGYDDADQLVHAGTVCNSSEAHALKGNWSGNNLRVEDSRVSYELSLVSSNELQFHVVNHGGGPVFDLTLHR